MEASGHDTTARKNINYTDHFASTEYLELLPLVKLVYLCILILIICIHHNNIRYPYDCVMYYVHLE